MTRLTHIDSKGSARMVDVSEKPKTARRAAACATIRLNRETIELIRKGKVPKGDVGAVARIAGIMAAKKTPELIPLCHPLSLTSVQVDVRLNENENSIEIEASVRTTGETGVEMEALTSASVAALAVYDMCKAVCREAVISDIMLLEKSGGKSGTFKRKS
ncbi:MAG: cyclic pyranopterin monophosphate synthase MoaC [Nitrospiraceae bacterium]|nr:cyclic pyranopterin monophosphate synthase MoaC [Nitrospiraceae bacterium]